MQSRERVLCTIRHCEPGKVPKGEIYIDDEVVKETVLCEQADFHARYQFVSLLGLDIYCISPIYPQLKELPLVKEVVFPDLNNWSSETDLFVFVMLDGPFGWGVKLLGFEKFLLAVARQTADYRAFVEKVCRLNKELALRACEEGAHGVLIADDIAYQKGLLVNPKTLRESYFPFLAHLINGIKVKNTPVFFHSDGNLNEVIKDLIKSGFDGLQCLEKSSGMNIREIKEVYGKHLCLWGNLDIGELILPRSKAELQSQVKELVSSVSAGGGYIFGTSSGLIKGIDCNLVKNLYSMF